VLLWSTIIPRNLPLSGFMSRKSDSGSYGRRCSRTVQARRELSPFKEIAITASAFVHVLDASFFTLSFAVHQVLWSLSEAFQVWLLVTDQAGEILSKAMGSRLAAQGTCIDPCYKDEHSGPRSARLSVPSANSIVWLLASAAHLTVICLLHLGISCAWNVLFYTLSLRAVLLMTTSPSTRLRPDQESSWSWPNSASWMLWLRCFSKLDCKYFKLSPTN